MGVITKKNIIFICLLLYVHSGNAIDSLCLDPQKANSVIEKFRWWNSKNTPLSDFSLCDSTSAVYKVVNALLVMKDLPPLNDRKDEFNFNIIDSPPLDFFSQRVTDIFFDDQRTSYCASGTTLAYVLIKTSVVHICPAILASSSTEVMKVLIHESRHTEGYGHVLCDHGDQSNSNIYACDQSYEIHGSYGIDTEFQVRLARTKEVPVEIRTEARLGAINRLLNRFNKYPAGVKEGIFGETNDGRLLFLAKDTLSVVSENVKNGILINFNGIPGWYDKMSSQVFLSNYSGGFFPIKGSIINQITEILLKHEGEQLTDYYYNLHDRYICILSRNALDCSIFLKDEIRTASYTLPDKSDSFLYLKEFVGIRLRNGAIVALPQYIDLLNASDQSLSEIENRTSSYKNVVTVEGGKFSYNLDSLGIVYEINGAEITTSSLTKDLRFKKIIGPFMWSNLFNGIR